MRQTNEPIVDQNGDQRNDERVRDLHDVSADEVRDRCVKFGSFFFEKDHSFRREDQRYRGQRVSDSLNSKFKETTRKGSPVQIIFVVLAKSGKQTCCEDRSK